MDNKYKIANKFLCELEGTEGQDRENYSDEQDRDSYSSDNSGQTPDYIFKYEDKGIGPVEVSVNPYPSGDLELRLYKSQGEKGNNHCRVLIPKEKVKEFVDFFDKQVSKENLEDTEESNKGDNNG